VREQRRECLTYRRKRGAECRRLLPALTKLAAIDRHDVDDLSSPSLALMHKLALELHNAARSVSETGHEPTNQRTNLPAQRWFTPWSQSRFGSRRRVDLDAAAGIKVRIRRRRRWCLGVVWRRCCRSGRR